MPVVKVEFTTKVWQEISKLARREMLEPRSYIADVLQKHIAAQQSVQADGALCADCGKSPAMEGCTVCAECGL